MQLLTLVTLHCVEERVAPFISADSLSYHDKLRVAKAAASKLKYLAGSNLINWTEASEVF